MGEWEAFEDVEGPITIQKRLDAIAAWIAFIVAKSQGMKRKNGRDVTLDDFRIEWDLVKAETDSAKALEAFFKGAASPQSPNSSSS